MGNAKARERKELRKAIAARRRQLANEPTNLPDKIEGDHRFVCVVSYAVTAGQASAAASGASLSLGNGNRIGAYLVCFDCEQSYTDAKGKRCDAASKTEVIEPLQPDDLEGATSGVKPRSTAAADE